MDLSLKRTIGISFNSSFNPLHLKCPFAFPNFAIVHYLLTLDRFSITEWANLLDYKVSSAIEFEVRLSLHIILFSLHSSHAFPVRQWINSNVDRKRTVISFADVYLYWPVFQITTRTPARQTKVISFSRVPRAASMGKWNTFRTVWQLEVDKSQLTAMASMWSWRLER